MAATVNIMGSVFDDDGTDVFGLVFVVATPTETRVYLTGRFDTSESLTGVFNKSESLTGIFNTSEQITGRI